MVYSVRSKYLNLSSKRSQEIGVIFFFQIEDNITTTTMINYAFDLTSLFDFEIEDNMSILLFFITQNYMKSD